MPGGPPAAMRADARGWQDTCRGRRAVGAAPSLCRSGVGGRGVMAPPEAGAEWLRKWDLKGAEKAEARQAGDSAAADLVHAALAGGGGSKHGAHRGKAGAKHHARVRAGAAGEQTPSPQGQPHPAGRSPQAGGQRRPQLRGQRCTVLISPRTHGPGVAGAHGGHPHAGQPGCPAPGTQR